MTDTIKTRDGINPGWLSGDEQAMTPEELEREQAAGRERRIADIQARANSATPGPWRWRGNADNHDISLENRHWVVLGTQRIERTADDPEVRSILEYLLDSSDELLSDEELTALGIDLDNWRAVEAAQEAHLLPIAVEMHLHEDEWGNVGYDERLAMRTSGDDDARLIPLEQQAIYEVCPDATDRSDPRVYRADYNATRSPDAEFIAHARADIDYLLSEVARLQSAVVDAYHNGYADGQASNSIKVTTVHAYEDGVRDERSRISEALETLPLALADDEGTPVDGFTRTDVRRIVHDVPTLSECAGDAD